MLWHKRIAHQSDIFCFWKKAVTSSYAHFCSALLSYTRSMTDCVSIMLKNDESWLLPSSLSHQHVSPQVTGAFLGLLSSGKPARSFLTTNEPKWAQINWNPSSCFILCAYSQPFLARNSQFGLQYTPCWAEPCSKSRAGCGLSAGRQQKWFESPLLGCYMKGYRDGPWYLPGDSACWGFCPACK